jgi:hypothetical protein
VGRDRHARGGDAAAFDVAEAGDFVPLTYAGDTYSAHRPRDDRRSRARLCRHNLALLALPVVLGAIALAGRPLARRFRLWRAAPIPA